MQYFYHSDQKIRRNLATLRELSGKVPKNETKALEVESANSVRSPNKLHHS